MIPDVEPKGRLQVPQAVIKFVPLHAPGPFTLGYVIVQFKVCSPRV